MQLQTKVVEVAHCLSTIVYISNKKWREKMLRKVVVVNAATKTEIIFAGFVE